MMPKRTTTIPYRNWTLRERVIEQIYRKTHRGQIRTLVVREPNMADEIVNRFWKGMGMG